MKHIRILIADPHPLVLEGYGALLNPSFDVIGFASDGLSLVNEAARLQPDIVLLAISLPLLNGLEAIPYLKKRCPATKLIVVTGHNNPNYAAQAYRLGISGYLLKSSSSSELKHAIKEVALGRSYLTSMMAKELLENLMDSPAKNNGYTVSPTFTKRQREILQLVVEGHTTKDIAAILHVSVRTIESHKGSLMTAVGVRTTAMLIKYSLEHKLVT